MTATLHPPGRSRSVIGSCRRWPRWQIWTLWIIAVLFTVGSAVAGSYRVDEATVTIHCPLTVGGSFKAMTEALTGELVAGEIGPLEGSFEVDLSSLETGIGLRDRHLRDKYLEVGRGEGYDKAVLTDIVLLAREAGDERRQPFTATLALHGEVHELSGSCRIDETEAGYEIEATMPVHVPDYGIAKPRHLGIGVKDTVRITVTLALVAAPADAPADTPETAPTNDSETAPADAPDDEP